MCLLGINLDRSTIVTLGGTGIHRLARVEVIQIVYIENRFIYGKFKHAAIDEGIKFSKFA